MTILRIFDGMQEVMGKINNFTKTPTTDDQGRNYYCGMCAYESKNEEEVKKHRHEQHANPPVYHSCNICDTRCNDMNSLNEHKKKHVKNHKCNNCLFKSDSKQELDEHITRRHREKFVCEWCDFVTHVKGEISEHEKNEHNIKKARKMLNCDKCANVYRSVSDLKNHVDDAHRQKSPRSMMRNKFSFQEKKRNGFCRFWNNAECKFNAEDCRFIHEKAPHCLYQDRCIKPRCQFFHTDASVSGNSRSLLGDRPQQSRWGRY